jgi:2-desacetyl-2-hydroxyethyl bacteriochlorophyllide A dehydrogenase
MQALLYTESHSLEVQDLPEPAPAAGEVVLSVEGAGICASDVDGVASRSPRRTPPLVMGHELVGSVIESEDGSGRPLIGARVAVNPQVTCGDCRWCRSGSENICARRGLIGGTRPGGFAERVSVPVRCVHRLSDGIAADAAIFAEPLATCVHAVRLARAQFVDTAVVLGAGTIGTLAAQLLRLACARQVIVSEPLLERHALLASFADAAVAPADLPRTVDRMTRGDGAELCIDAVGTEASRRDSLCVLAPGGSAVWIGMHAPETTIPAFDMVVGERRAIGSFAYTNSEFASAVGLIESGRIEPKVTHRSVPLADGAAVFQRLLGGDADSVLKQIIRP